MTDDSSLYVINESFIHPSDKWVVQLQSCSYILNIYIKVASQVPKLWKLGNITEITNSQSYYLVLSPPPEIKTFSVRAKTF